MKLRMPEQLIPFCQRSALLLTAVVILLAMAIPPCRAENKVVLIAAKASGIEMLSNRDIRRIFLGLKSADSEIVNKPVINLHNKEVYEQFLKNVMHMTEGAYKRKLVKRVFRHGTAAIKEVDRLNELNRHLSNHVGDISFIDYTELKHMPDVEIVQVLW